MQIVYRNVVFDHTCPWSSSEISALEDILGASLPKDFLDFSAVVGGGVCEFSFDVPFPRGGNRTLALRDWHGFKCRTTFAEALDFARKTFHIPQKVLPIANSDWENFVFLDLTQEGGGRVVVFVMGKPAWTGWSTESTWTTVAESFTELLDRMYLDDETVELLQEELGDDEEEDRRIERILDIGRPGWRAAPS
ncbi:SMI1/KNR4 family protein [Deinococcus sp. YIM 134068]|uniref:SMI1/KNR4 family protein n=1 Tax=Deinococcus lichenicola TaxID=3118910 RepID=UPI002F923B2D